MCLIKPRSRRTVPRTIYRTVHRTISDRTQDRTSDYIGPYLGLVVYGYRTVHRTVHRTVYRTVYRTISDWFISDIRCQLSPPSALDGGQKYVSGRRLHIDRTKIKIKIRPPLNPNKPVDWERMSPNQREKWNKRHRLPPVAPQAEHSEPPIPTEQSPSKIPDNWNEMSTNQRKKYQHKQLSTPRG